MLYRTFGQDCFFAGVREYLQLFAFGNVDEHDLWTALENKQREVCPGRLKIKGRLPLEVAMANWTRLAGVPLLTVTRDHATGGAYIKQARK
jgi:aminopeptidase N